MKILAAVLLLAQVATPTPTCPPILPTCIPQTPQATWTPIGPTKTRTPTPHGPTATRTRTRTPGPTQPPPPTPTPGGAYNPCPSPCDLYAIQFDYHGTWAPDVTGPFPPNYFLSAWPRSQDWRGPGNYSLAYKAHTPQGGWQILPSVVTFYVAGPNPAFSAWDEELYHEGITAGCGTNPLIFCPLEVVTRQQMAVFLLKAMHGNGYQPPPCTGIFADVPCPRPTVTP